MHDENYWTIRYLLVISQIINNSTIVIDVYFLDQIIVLIKVNEMADADNRVILNVGGIRHETCMFIF